MAKRDAMIDGVMPRRGYLLVNKSKGMVYGVVSHIKLNGTVVWKSYVTKAKVKSDPEHLRMSGCTYEESNIVGKD